MKNKSLFAILLLTAILSISTFSCNSGGTSKVTITIDLGLHNKAAFNAPESSIINRVLRFFAKDAEAAPPSNISSIMLNITGEGMDKITQNYPATQSIITIDVPAGDSRTFEILAYTPSATLRGAATRNLSGGATVTIPIQMGVYETKIVIPDYTSGRIVQIDDMSGNGWTPKNGVSIGLTGTFSPNDIDFDYLGRIYITNVYSGTGSRLILRLNDITDTSNTPIITDTTVSTTVYALAINRNLNYIYYATTNAIYRCNIDGSSNQLITLTDITFTTIRGLAVDDSGNLYIAATTSGPVQEVIKWIPPILTNFIRYSTNLTEPWDVLIKEDSLYITNRNGASGYKIMQLNLGDLSLVNNNGVQATGTTDTAAGHLFGPKRFVAILNRKIFIVDEASTMDIGWQGDRLVGIDDISMNGWQAVGSTGTGTNQFQFYQNC